MVDRLVALMALIILSPLILVTAMLLYFSNGGDIFFRQLRPGKNEKPFWVVKFKTMTDTANLNGGLLSDTERLTLVGKWVRRVSLDEVPQLFNILKGEMSIVGPRPLLMEYLALYNKKQRRRHEVSPGITGWAQVNGRNKLEWQKRFEHDVWYVDNVSFFLDVKIVIRTIVKVMKAEGINSATSATVEKFEGNG